jgi:hypothetical protein
VGLGRKRSVHKTYDLEWRRHFSSTESEHLRQFAGHTFPLRLLRLHCGSPIRRNRSK